MTKRMLKLFAMVYAFFGFAAVARAGILPTGAIFSFFTNDLQALFLAPFAILGCGGG